MKNSQSLNIPSSINSFMNSQTNDNKIGSKTKLLWQNPEYRKHMSEVHKGHPKALNAYCFPKGCKMQLGKIGELAPHWKGGKEIYKERHKKQKMLYLKIWRENNHLRYRKSTNEWRRKYYQKNKEKLILFNKKWQLNNPLKVKFSKKRNKIFRRGFGFISNEIIQMIYEDNIKKYGTLTCYLCFKSIEFGQDSLEHKIPLSRGGTNEYNNLDVAHRRCNSRKYNKTIEEYQDRQRLLEIL